MSAPGQVSGYSIASLLGIQDGLSTGDSRSPRPGSGRSVPGGIESVLEYNSTFINVRDWIDTYLVTTIGGLDDADVRDTREVNPGYHGETAYPGYYGGRTITLTGKVYAHTLFKLRDMQKGLRQAFSDLSQELPLIFRTPDPNLDMMIYCKKSQSIQMTEEQRTANHFERPFLITLRASNPRFLSVVKVQSAYKFSNLYDFTQQQTMPVIKETFDDPGVLNLYNARGDGFKVDTGMLRSNGKANVTNLIKNPDFDAAVTTHPTTLLGCRIAPSSSGGVDDGAYCVINADSDRIEMTWEAVPVIAGQRYSVSMWVKAPVGCIVGFTVQWNTASSYWADLQWTGDKPATGQWQEIKLENMWAIDDPTPSFDAVSASLRLVIYNGVVGNAYGVDKVMFVSGAALPSLGFFDGDHPLAKWTGAQYTSTSILYPYTILTTNRLMKKPMMVIKVNSPTIDGTHPWGNPDIQPEGFRIVLAYVDDGNQVYVTSKGKTGSNRMDFVLVVWRNGVRETYDTAGLIGMDNSAYKAGDLWYRAFMKNGEVVMERWTVDPYSGATDASREWNQWKLTAEQSALFEQSLPMQLIAFDEQYAITGGSNPTMYQDTIRIDEFTYQSIDDLPGWEYVSTTSGMLNGTPRNYSSAAFYTNNNRLYSLWWDDGFILRNDLPSPVGDGTITMKIRYEDPVGSLMIQGGIIAKYIDKDNFIFADVQIYSATNMTIHVGAAPYGSAGGFTNYLDFPKTDWPEDTDRWLRLVMNGNTFTVQFWTTDPALGGSPLRTQNGTLTGAAAAKMGAGVKGRVGLFNTSAVPSFFMDDYLISQTAAFNDTVIDVTNLGNFRAQPVITLNGPLTNLQLTNEANDEWMSIPTTIPNGEVWILDIENRRMYRESDMANRFQYLDANSDWMELEPGENPISASVTGMAAASQIGIDFHHTVM